MTPGAVESLPTVKFRLRMIGKVFDFFAKGPAPTGKLDFEAMPDRVKRDLGFLDGRDPRYEDDRMR